MRKNINVLIITDDKKLLLLKKDVDLLILPGGEPREGESHKKTLKRKFKEDASGARLKRFEYYKTFKGEDLEAVTYFAKLKKPHSKIIPSGEIRGIKYIGFQNTILDYFSPMAKKVINQLIDDKHL